MFEYNLRRIEDGLRRALSLRKEARQLRNPSRFVRFWTEPIVESDGRSRMEHQAEIDEKRKELLKEADECMSGITSDFVEIFQWLEDRNVRWQNVSNQLVRKFSDYPRPEDAAGIAAEMNDLVRLVELTERAEEAARRAEEELRDAASEAARSSGCNIDVDIEQY